MGGATSDSAALQELWLAAKAARQAGDLATSTARLREANALAPDNPLILRQLATQLRHTGQLGEALALLEPALPRAGEHPELALALADCLVQHRGASAALSVLEYALNQRPDEPAELLLGKARLHYMLAERAEASALLRRVVQRTPERGDAWALLGAIDFDDGNIDEASLSSRLALKYDTRQALAHGTLGQILAEAGDVEAARAAYMRALAIEPENARIHYMLGLTSLMIGDFESGWQGYAQRHRLVPRVFADYSYDLPRWYPEDAAPEGRLMVWTEQGVGDEILFAGMMGGLLVHEVRPILLCDARLAPLFSRSLPGVEVVGRNAAFVPWNEGVRRQIAIGDLGGLLRRSALDFPRRTRYLAADPVRVRHFRSKYAAMAEPGAKLVGIAWRSSNRAQGPHKSAALADFMPLMKQPGHFFVNLQYGSTAAEIAALRERHGLVLHNDGEVDPLQSLDDHAAQIAALDAVISTSNSAVHMAGALGVPTWLLLPAKRGVQWYWGRTGEMTPWYSSLRLLRAGETETLAALIARHSGSFPAWAQNLRR